MAPRHRLFSALVPLGPTHIVAGFACGDDDIDRFLHVDATSEQALGLSQIYVTTNIDHEVLGYFTISPIAVRVERALLARLGLSSAPYPAIGGFLLGRLGVTKQVQRQGVGEALVARASQIAKREAEVVGGLFLAVDPKDDGLARWYAALDFQPLGGTLRRMIRPLRSVP